MIKPIFVVGNNRSGTKFTSNLILNNQSVSGVQNEYHRGILETNVFNNAPKVFGPLSERENYIAFVESFAATDFFKTTNLNKEILYQKRTRNYYDFFRYVMNSYAKKNNAKFWLQKIHPYVLPRVYLYFTDAKYIFIKREVVDTVRSAVNHQKKMNTYTKCTLLKETFLYWYGIKIMNSFDNKHKDNILFIDFEELVNYTEKVVKRICSFIDLHFFPDMLISKYKRNTSFTNKWERATFLSRIDTILIKLFSFLFLLMPLFFYTITYQLCISMHQRKKSFLSDTFYIISREKNI